MKAKYQIYKVTLHSGEIYIGQHKGNVLTDGYIGTPSGKNGCNSYTLEDIARIEVIDFANEKKDIDSLEAKYIERYRKIYGISDRISKVYPFLLKRYKNGVCLNICSNIDFRSFTKQLTRDFVTDQYDMNGDYVNSFYSFSEAAKAVDTKTCGSEIKKCCQGIYHNCKNFVWRFHVENPPSHIEITKHKRQPNCRKVAQYNRDKKYIATYDSIGEASRTVKISKTCIRKCACHEKRTAGGYIWEFVG